MQKYYYAEGNTGIKGYHFSLDTLLLQVNEQPRSDRTLVKKCSHYMFTSYRVATASHTDPTVSSRKKSKKFERKPKGKALPTYGLAKSERDCEQENVFLVRVTSQNPKLKKNYRNMKWEISCAWPKYSHLQFKINSFNCL